MILTIIQAMNSTTIIPTLKRKMTTRNGFIVYTRSIKTMIRNVMMVAKNGNLFLNLMITKFNINRRHHLTINQSYRALRTNFTMLDIGHSEMLRDINRLTITIPQWLVSGMLALVQILKGHLQFSRPIIRAFLHRIRHRRYLSGRVLPQDHLNN